MKPASRMQQLDLFGSNSNDKPAADTCREEMPAGLDEELTAQSRNLISGLGLPDLAAKVRVIWNLRLRTTAGRAFRNTSVVELNSALWVVSREEIDRTLRHELAHLVAFARAGRRRIEPHGREWQKACADLGIPGEARCHDLPFERRQMKRKLAYECPNCGNRIERVRRIKQAAACYDCCRKFNGGRFSSRYRLKEVRIG